MSHLPTLVALLNADKYRRRILQQVRALHLPDCWVAAGFVRSAVWDHRHGRASSSLSSDIDVIWFDRGNASPERDSELKAQLQNVDKGLDWSVKNQARMHLRNGDRPYESATDAMRYWPETATAVAVRLNADDELEVAAPFGLNDLFDLVVRPAGRFRDEKRHLFLKRLQNKDWLAKWPGLKVLD
ncbi:nucleotidyltransferase family protein [Pseudomonas sp. CNPSo 3701]|uniref:nucleotidyltransferase family protein n=1 Tax=Pseudomonas sp. CNPSo 3701 TaxID=3027943 RepID=UPI002363E5AF|nr:nucleotidyltransferase family protein [Pseudomonas sp. CNPSo 3701]MDD1508786.1 nucleotidyltransferase family protein [Pseudomonas sp. CNPSo 3701]